MSFQDCSVVFHGSPQGILYTGQQITGIFRIKQDEPREIRDGSVIIEAGLSTFDFSFILPPGLRSSFEGIHGNTRYTMKVTAERNDKFDKTKNFSLIVICSTDLNLNLENRMPIHRVVTKNFSSLFFDKGTLDMTIDLPMSGYIPGQQLPIKCLVKNKSRVFIESVVFCLENNVTYYSSYPVGHLKTEKQKKVIVTGHQVEKDSESLLDVALNLPALPASRPVDSLITIQYFVKVKAVASGMHSNLKIQIPVNIGTIPVYTQSFANPSTVAHFKPQHLEVPATAFYPSCPDLFQAPCPNMSGFVTPGPQRPPLQYSGFAPFDSPQFPSLQNSQLPPFRSLHLLPTPTAPPLRSDDFGLPTYEEAQRMAKMTKDNTEDGDRGADHSPGNSDPQYAAANSRTGETGDYYTKTYPWI